MASGMASKISSIDFLYPVVLDWVEGFEGVEGVEGVDVERLRKKGSL